MDYKTFIMPETIADDNSKVVTKKKDYFITIVVGADVRNINLNDFKKEKITFGRDNQNDIIIPSLYVSKEHGYFLLEQDSLTIVDKNSKNGIYLNNSKIEKSILKNNDILRIDNLNNSQSKGILLMVSNGNLSKWQHYNLAWKEKIIIGTDSECNIVLDDEFVAGKHAQITYNDGKYYINSVKSSNKIFVNGQEISKPTLLNDKDVILISKVKLIYNKNHILYQFSEDGVKVEAYNIYKTVKVKFKKRDISQNINLVFEPGDFVSFVGGSGAGKTTFLKCISGLSQPTKGQVLINGLDLYKNYDIIKTMIGYVPQDDIVFKNLTLYDMLKYSADLRMSEDASFEEKQRRIRSVLETVDLVGKEDVMIKNLSGGQRKRASIAVELLADPRLFFLDEPTSGLDPSAERNIMEILRKMASEGRTIILVTHNTLNLHLCDKVVFFGRGGKVCFAGSPEQSKKFFGVDDFVECYTQIDKEPDVWHKRYLNSEYNIYQKKEIKLNSNEEKKKKNFILQHKKSFFKQFVTLVKRYLKTIYNNKFQLLLLTFQTPIIAIALISVLSNQLFEYYEFTKQVIFSMATAGIYIGLGNSIQEICKERVILHKEYLANLRISAYLSSKVFVLLLLSLLQSLLFILTFTFFVEVPSDGIVFSWVVEITLEMTLTIFSASALGLVVSTLASDPSIAMTYVPLLLVPQMLFCGMFFELEGFLKYLSNMILCKWSLELFGITMDMNVLISQVQDAVPGYIREAEAVFEFTTKHFYNDVAIISCMSIFLIVLTYICIKYQLEGDNK